MRLPRFRFTIRRMMVLVAVVAIIVALTLRMAARHHMMIIHIQSWGENRGFSHNPNLAPAEQARALRRVKHHWELIGKYQRAARYPWLPIEPDPPEPD